MNDKSQTDSTIVHMKKIPLNGDGLRFKINNCITLIRSLTNQPSK